MWVAGDELVKGQTYDVETSYMGFTGVYIGPSLGEDSEILGFEFDTGWADNNDKIRFATV